MKKLFIIFTFLLFSCQPPDYNPADIHRWINDYTLAVKSANIENLLALFQEDVQYYPPNHTTVSGKEALGRWFLSYFNYYDNISEKLWVRDVRVAGDVAYVTCNYSFFATVGNDEARDSGKVIYLFRHKHAGKWICTHAMWNNNNRTFDLHSEIPADFSGHWKLDPSRSSKAIDVISSTLFITQDHNNIRINRFYELHNKRTLENSSNYTVGKEMIGANKNKIFSTKCFWSNDKQSFTIIEMINADKQENVRKTVYSIIAKGEILSIISDDMIGGDEAMPAEGRHIEMFYYKL